MHASPTAKNVCFFFILIFTFPVRSPSFVVVVVGCFFVVVVANPLLIYRDVLVMNGVCSRCACY